MYRITSNWPMPARPAVSDDIVATWEQAAANARSPLLVTEPLVAFLDDLSLGSGPLEAEPIGDGHSNVTYLVRRSSGAELILRRPPRPPLPPSAHDVLREARLLEALAPTAVRAPHVIAVCADECVIGVPFYLMERARGNVITTELPAELDNVEQRTNVAAELIEALVEVHAADWRAAGLEDFGKPTGYLERQLRRFGGLWEINRTRELEAVDSVGHWLAEHMPDSPAATIVHGDYRLGNTMFAAGAPARLVAVFDWEMATIGDPLADVGYMCALWTEAGDGDRGMFALSEVTRGEGFPTRERLVAMYEERSGRSMRDIRWYTTLALWKATVFMEGNYKRALAGATDDPYLRQFGDGVAQLAESALELTRGG